MTLKVGIIGCGNISDTYLGNRSLFRDLCYTACADLRPEAAAARAETFGLQALSVDALLARDDIDIVLNLTVPAAHAEISLRAIEAGKHVFSEKPMAVSLSQGRAMLEAAEERGLRVGMAPDTVLGPGLQIARRLVDEGRIGKVVNGLAAVLSHGMEDWHPSPEFFFKQGGGPVLDLGPYYISALVQLLGPIRQVQAVGSIGNTERIVTAEGPMKGRSIKVETFTTLNALLSFHSGVDIPFLASWDVWSSDLRPIELHGAEGSLRVPDPNGFGGVVAYCGRGGDFTEIDTSGMPFGADNRLWNGQLPYSCYRGLGMADMASSLKWGVAHRCSAELGFHTLEVLLALEEAARSHRAVIVSSTCERPEILTMDGATALMSGSGADVCSAIVS
ncbi:Gfo/Idh/MocA family protein [Rhizobium sp. CF142]|uniref:Gfo/Idh/MocA family protein n=1 Tax=Rhizobium sp. CF142 TaxID=1144314 RepID=UPI00026EEAF6|nr:Gfo/Idh/MocA family oxidoreductase [Rhizobium sp. CF142]EJJ31502.1 putative dehydrogenase [Rhizobium sp. CF142]